MLPEPNAEMYRKVSGGIAQLVEQMTFNHWVQSSNLCASTTIETTVWWFFHFCPQTY